MKRVPFILFCAFFASACASADKAFVRQSETNPEEEIVTLRRCRDPKLFRLSSAWLNYKANDNDAGIDATVPESGGRAVLREKSGDGYQSPVFGGTNAPGDAANYGGANTNAGFPRVGGAAREKTPGGQNSDEAFPGKAGVTGGKPDAKPYGSAVKHDAGPGGGQDSGVFSQFLGDVLGDVLVLCALGVVDVAFTPAYIAFGRDCKTEQFTRRKSPRQARPADAPQK